MRILILRLGSFCYESLVHHRYRLYGFIALVPIWFHHLSMYSDSGLCISLSVVLRRMCLCLYTMHLFSSGSLYMYRSSSSLDPSMDLLPSVPSVGSHLPLCRIRRMDSPLRVVISHCKDRRTLDLFFQQLELSFRHSIMWIVILIFSTYIYLLIRCIYRSLGSLLCSLICTYLWSSLPPSRIEDSHSPKRCLVHL